MDIEIKTFVDNLDCIVDKTNFSRSNYFKFRNTKTFVAIKISRSSKPFFGIGKQVIDLVNSNNDKFYLVLLVSDKSGWIYSKNEVNSNIKNRFWKLAQDTDYKINNGELSASNYFTSFNIFQEKIILKGGRGDLVL